MSLMYELDYLARRIYFSFKAFMIYRAQAATWVFASFFETLIPLLAINVIYTVSPGIAGWNYYQLLCLAAVGNIFSSVMWFLISPWGMVRNMVSGGVDAYLTKPYSKATALLSTALFPGGVAGSISGLALLVYALVHLHVTVISVIGFMGVLILGFIALFWFSLAVTVLSYHVLKSATFIARVLNYSDAISSYPLTVFGIVGQMIFTLVIPFGLAYYYPSLALLGLLSVSGYALVIGVTVAITLASYAAFNFLIKGYASGGG